MQSHTKFARLSRRALICQHGRALREYGFTERDSHLLPYTRSVLTTMHRPEGWYYPSGTVTGRQSSGRPAIQNIPRVVRSTSARQFREIASMYSTDELRAALCSALQKTSSLPSRSDRVVLPVVMPSWGLNSGHTRSDFWRDSARVASFFGSIPMVRGMQRVVSLGDSFDSLALSHYQS